MKAFQRLGIKATLLTTAFLTLCDLGSVYLSDLILFYFRPAHMSQLQKCPFQELSTHCSWCLKHYTQVLCMAGFFLNFRSQLKCHLLSQVIPKVPTILPNLLLYYITLIFSSHTFIRVYNKFMYLFVIVCISQQNKPLSYSVLFRISLSVLVSVSLAPGRKSGLIDVNRREMLLLIQM